MLIDLHVQSHFSRNGKLDPEEIILYAKKQGLDGLCFTEDQPFTEWKELKELGEVHDTLVLVGLECKTNRGVYLLFGPNPEDVEPNRLLPPLRAGQDVLSFEDVHQAAERAGGVLIAAHPYKLDVDHPSGDRLFELDGLTCIQTQNSHVSPLVNDFAIEACYHLGLKPVGGSQTRETLRSIGSSATMFTESITNETELVAALKASRAWPVEITPEPTIRESADNDRGGDRRGGGGRGGDRGGRDNRGGDRRGGGRGGDRRGGGRGGDRRGGGRGGDRRGRR